jgi:hypothetical protein
MHVDVLGLPVSDEESRDAVRAKMPRIGTSGFPVPEEDTKDVVYAQTSRIDRALDELSLSGLDGKHILFSIMFCPLSSAQAIACSPAILIYSHPTQRPKTQCGPRRRILTLRASTNRPCPRARCSSCENASVRRRWRALLLNTHLHTIRRFILLQRSSCQAASPTLPRTSSRVQSSSRAWDRWSRLPLVLCSALETILSCSPRMKRTKPLVPVCCATRPWLLNEHEETPPMRDMLLPRRRRPSSWGRRLPIDPTIRSLLLHVPPAQCRRRPLLERVHSGLCLPGR